MRKLRAWREFGAFAGGARARFAHSPIVHDHSFISIKGVIPLARRFAIGSAWSAIASKRASERIPVVAVSARRALELSKMDRGRVVSPLGQEATAQVRTALARFAGVAQW